MSLSTTQKIVRQMRDQGNQPGLISIFKTEMGNWARLNKTKPDAQAILAWLPNFKSRPFYTAAELVPLFPALGLVLGFERRLMGQMSSERLSNELKFCKLPVLLNSNGKTRFMHPSYPMISSGYKAEFFVVEQIHKWQNVKLSQEEFEEFF